MAFNISRRRFLAGIGVPALSGWGMVPGRRVFGDREPSVRFAGAVTGQPRAASVGRDVLASGGNAVDAIVAAALTAGVVDPQKCGIAGYGGHMTIALARAKTVTSIDFNSTAPAAATHDMFPVNDAGRVPGGTNMRGWLAAGVPGILAGMQLALDRYGTRDFRESVQPAIEYARDGFPLSADTATAIRRAAERFRTEPGSASVYLPGGRLPAEGETFRNPELADVLQTLARRNSVDSFYRGDIAQRISEAFQNERGLVTTEDLAAYQAREVSPIRFEWNGDTIYTAPLTAGGATVIQTLATLKALDWESLAAGPDKTHALLEAIRIAWHDRLALFGDPQHVDVPLDRLLSAEYSRHSAGLVQRAVSQRKPVNAATRGRDQNGTIHLSAADRAGNMVALTLTHGGSFGTQVTIPGLGLTMGHGMSRFDPRANHPNSPGPGKRPLHNMCPTIVVREGHPILALGGRGGRRIPNSIIQVLARFVGEKRGMNASLAAARLHNDGNLDLWMEKQWPADHVDSLKRIGYQHRTGSVAVVDAVRFDPATGSCESVTR